jgi:hypothetical protein
MEIKRLKFDEFLILIYARWQNRLREIQRGEMIAIIPKGEKP